MPYYYKKKVSVELPGLDDDYKDKIRKEIRENIKKIETKTPKQNLEAQLDMVGGIDEEANEKLSVRDILEKNLEIDYDTLSLKIKSEIAIERIKVRPEYEVFVPGIGKIEQARGIDEIQKKSKLGKRLINIEIFTIQFVLEKAKRKIQAGELDL
ncbi:MAG: hypothetical protein ACFFAK_08910 [Promethearchaeota archaeon]